MIKIVRTLAGAMLMGIPIWLVLASLAQDSPALLTIHLSEPNVTIWVSNRQVYAISTTVGPIEVNAGEHTFRVTRDAETLYSSTIVVEPGGQMQLKVRWPSHDIIRPGGATLSDQGEQRFEGQWSIINALSFSGDGTFIFSAGSDGSIRIWDVARGCATGELKGPVGKIVAVAAPAGSSQILTVGDDAIVRYWDLATNEEVMSIKTGVCCPIRCAAIACDGKQVALASDGNTMGIFDLESRRMARIHRIERASAGSLAFSPDGKTVLVGLIGGPTTRNDVQLLEIASGRILARLQGHEEPVWSVAFLPNGRRAVSAGSDRTLRLWDLATGRELKRFDDHPGVVLCVAVSPDGRRALTGTGHLWSDGWRTAGSYGLQLWDLEAGIGLGRFETLEPIRTLALSPDGRRAFASGDDRIIHAWTLPSGSIDESSEVGPG